MRTTPSAQEIKAWKESPNWESRYLDFKAREALADPSIMPNDVVENKDWEVARDVASFANTPNGGYLIYGVEDDRKGRRLQDFAITDSLKTRLSEVLKRRIVPPVNYDIDVVSVEGNHVTVFTVQEGTGDLCMVNGAIYIRDVSGRAIAAPSQVTDIVRKRLGLKAPSAPTQHEVRNSPYNLPTLKARSDAMLNDFDAIAPALGFFDIKPLPTIPRFNEPVTEYWGRACVRCIGNQRWHFIVMAFGANFNTQEFRTVTGLNNIRPDGEKPIIEVLGNYVHCPLVLTMGSIGDCKSQAEHFGITKVTLPYGAYFGHGSDAKIGSWQVNIDHRFILGGITDQGRMRHRLDQFLEWLGTQNDLPYSEAVAEHHRLDT